MGGGEGMLKNNENHSSFVTFFDKWFDELKYLVKRTFTQFYCAIAALTVSKPNLSVSWQYIAYRWSLGGDFELTCASPHCVSCLYYTNI